MEPPVPRSTAIDHIIRQDDGTSVGRWGDFALHTAFQPIFAFTDDRLSVIAFERLMRPFRDGEALSPQAFLALVPSRDRYEVETLTRNLHLVNAATFLPDNVDIFVNFDPSVFTHQTVVDKVLAELRGVLRIAGLEPSRVVCEVTEQKTASRPALRRFVDALRIAGFRIAVDDYGSDESDMTRIRELSPDIIKFDGRWINRLMDTASGYGLLTTLVANFEAKGIRTVFEGIEEGWQIELTERAGASMVQGFALARPQIVPQVFTPHDQANKVAQEPPSNKKPNEETNNDADAGIPKGMSVRPFGRRGTD